MKTYELKQISGKKIKQLCSRQSIDYERLFDVVKPIIQNVKKNGDQALAQYTLKFDKVALQNIKVGKGEIDQAWSSSELDLIQSIETAIRNITKFHTTQIKAEKRVETMTGVECFQENRPIEKIGLYIPGGSAPLFSTLLMLAIPARIAGCKKIVLCTPANQKGDVSSPILMAAKLCGVKEIYKVGGAQAIAAMAYGTESIPKVDKIFGPGNQFVVAAKMLVSIDPDGAAIDMPAGPSEVLVIADRFANPKWVAADLLSQAEHGPDSQVVLLSNDQNIIRRVKKEIKCQLAELPRSEIAQRALNGSFCLVAESLAKAFEFSNVYAPEHLILNLKNAKTFCSKVVNAGSVFLGPYSTEAAGDYASGTNHTLPTSGYARSYSGVTVESFMKKISFQKITPKGALNIGPAVLVMAEKEGLIGHKKAMEYRIG